MSENRPDAMVDSPRRTQPGHAAHRAITRRAEDAQTR